VHSDIGGYVSLSVRIAGHKEPIYARSKELLMRWMELAAFTSVFRTHEGLDPSVAAQFDTDAETLNHLVRFATIYQALGFYRRSLVTEASTRGYPVVRHPFLHYPDDPTVRSLRYQFLLGADLLVAPVLDRGATSVRVYAPQGTDQWVNIWSGEDLGAAGAWHEAPAPMGQPAVFVRHGSPTQERLQEELSTRGLL
jgi:alpha-glucosidase